MLGAAVFAAILLPRNVLGMVAPAVLGETRRRMLPALRDKTDAEIESIAESAGPEELAAAIDELISTPDHEATRVLQRLLGCRHANTWLKPLPSQLAMRGLLRIGTRGTTALRRALLDPDTRVRYSWAVLAELWNVSRGQGFLDLFQRGYSFAAAAPSIEVQQAAARVVRDIFAEALVNADAFGMVGNFVYQLSLRSRMPVAGGDIDPAEIMALFAEASIRLSRSVLEELRDLIAANEREEIYQEFLKRHPVVLDPLAAEVLSKQRLGSEHATDFAIRRHDDRWVLVEIERPHDQLFTDSDDFRARFTHAFGQVLDFQSWVDENVAYAQRLMPRVVAPRGLLVMGLRSELTDRQRSKLGRFVDNSQRIEVITYDDLLARAESLYSSLHRIEQLLTPEVTSPR